MLRRHACHLAIFFTLILLSDCSSLGQSLPADFLSDYEQLVSILDQGNPSALDIAQGSYLATQFFSVGAPGLSPMESRFPTAQTPGQASVAGLYVVLYGQQKEIEGVRRELETNEMKRKWLYGMVGNERSYMNSIQGSAQWRPMLQLLPSTSGCRVLVTQCLQSRDPLVRRAGLYWGYCMPDAAYWNSVKQTAVVDPNPVTRKMAAHLLSLKI